MIGRRDATPPPMHARLTWFMLRSPDVDAGQSLTGSLHLGDITAPRLCKAIPYIICIVIETIETTPTRPNRDTRETWAALPIAGLRLSASCQGSDWVVSGWGLYPSRLNIVCIRLGPSTTCLVPISKLIVSLDMRGATWYRPWSLCGWCYPIPYNALGDC